MMPLLVVGSLDEALLKPMNRLHAGLACNIYNAITYEKMNLAIYGIFMLCLPKKTNLT